MRRRLVVVDTGKDVMLMLSHMDWLGHTGGDLEAGARGFNLSF